MGTRFVIGLSFAILLLSSCQQSERTSLKVGMYNPAGDMIGTAKLTERPEGVEVKLSVEGLEAGPHGFHVYEFPKCEAPDFKSAGNHFNPTSKIHGLMNPEGAHIGDLPNVEADGSGMVDTEVMIREATLKDGKYSLLKGDGTSLIITEDQDDGFSQPAGDSGNRIACGLIQIQDNKEMPTDPTEQNKKKKEKK
ncbi:superoxide dismutase family protein [Thalassobacillus pellis]|uniref:superoxide dismutase family protein n=1 Tax=Thalassobacillus pellis TaxID=748008 RepID=UPI0019605644|nr:superoxide dismutase family protein [Thalassobacillus pellis]MBM7554861.1 Cu-Zn family superoxide dismutase [Thalassobacillus pellis]